MNLPENDSLDNILVSQKGLILERIHAKAYNEAEAMLSVVRELWAKVTPSYSYKWVELKNRILEEASKEEEPGRDYDDEAARAEYLDSVYGF